MNGFGVVGEASYRSPHHPHFRQLGTHQSSYHRHHHVLLPPSSGLNSSASGQETASAHGSQQQQQQQQGGDYLVNSHEMITSPQSRYEVLELLGEPDLYFFF